MTAMLAVPITMATHLTSSLSPVIVEVSPYSSNQQPLLIAASDTPVMTSLLTAAKVSPANRWIHHNIGRSISWSIYHVYT